MKLKITVNPEGGYVPLDDIHDFQNGMKILPEENYEKLKAEILEGFSFVLHVWKHPADGNIHCIDGHQRVTALQRMVEDGLIDMNPEVPAVFIQAKNWAEAKAKCLAAASQFGQFVTEGLQKTLADAGLTPLAAIEKFSFPTLEIPGLPEPEVEQDVDPIVSGHSALGNSIKQIMLYFPAEQYGQVCEMANIAREKMGCDDNSQLFLKLLEQHGKN